MIGHAFIDCIVAATLYLFQRATRYQQRHSRLRQSLRITDENGPHPFSPWLMGRPSTLLWLMKRLNTGSQIDAEPWGRRSSWLQENGWHEDELAVEIHCPLPYERMSL